MKGGQLSHQWRPRQISRLTLTRSKSRIINFMNSILPDNKLQITYLSLTTFSDITGCFALILQNSYFQALPIFKSKSHVPWSKLDKIPTHRTSTVSNIVGTELLPFLGGGGNLNIFKQTRTHTQYKHQSEYWREEMILYPGYVKVYLPKVFVVSRRRKDVNVHVISESSLLLPNKPNGFYLTVCSGAEICYVQM